MGDSASFCALLIIQRFPVDTIGHHYKHSGKLLQSCSCGSLLDLSGIHGHLYSTHFPGFLAFTNQGKLVLDLDFIKFILSSINTKYFIKIRDLKMEVEVFVNDNHKLEILNSRNSLILSPML